ncbi:uncharacterized protein BHQ10_006425 [Talaromyces amestolkiae]|uniref:SCP domain-containing protein n=1 Tax=Talaromyces amestolkiae TaxID=1196081 RepID=A0A364L3R9_TALAM|nr:uncharacterized protein BHQ10_006425 [Talaromyces amestolkiae]RAO70413.1 hypothetical protein BHQ10_006425 [Talaromyces amestolkiae]
MKGSLFVSALCVMGAAASPLNKRVLVTDIAVTVVTVTVTETPGAATSVPASTTSVAATTAPVAGAANVNNEYPRPPWTSTETETTIVVPSSTSSTSTYIAPEPATTVAPEPTTTAAPTTTAVEVSSTSTSVPTATGSAYQTLILDSHNIHRSNHSAPALTWNETLAESALALANTCDYHHDTSLGPAANYGQNIAYGIDSDKVDQIITNMMYNDEMMYYQGLYGEASPDMTNFEHWGHFSQIVWLDTTTVGCATVTCSNLAESGSSLALPFTVCNYYPAGNYGGEYGANVLSPLGNPIVIAS